MALLKIAHVGTPVLREQNGAGSGADELAAPETQRFIDDLIETMRDANGAGLAAPPRCTTRSASSRSVRPSNPRYPYKHAVPLTVVVNPVIEPLGDETFDNYEGCLSVPNLRAASSATPRVG